MLCIIGISRVLYVFHNFRRAVSLYLGFPTLTGENYIFRNFCAIDMLWNYICSGRIFVSMFCVLHGLFDVSRFIIVSLGIYCILRNYLYFWCIFGLAVVQVARTH